MRRMLFAAGVLTVGGLLAAGALWAAPAIEDDLAEEVHEVLTAAGLDAISVDVDGRTVAVSGRVPATSSPGAALALVADIDGIRQVRDEGLVAAPVGDPAPAAAPVVEIEVRDGAVEVRGSVADSAQLAALVGAAQAVAPTVVSRADVAVEPLSEQVRADLDALVTLLADLGGDFRSGTLTLAPGQLTLTATVAVDARARVDDAVRATGIPSAVSFDTADPP